MKLNELLPVHPLTGLEFKQSLRYGENPHQKATWSIFPGEGISNANQLQGKELSYNNLIDLDLSLIHI